MKVIFLNKRNTIILVILAVLVIAGLLLVYKSSFVERVEAREFVGKVDKIEGTQIFASGFFIVSDKDDLSNSQNVKDVKISVSPDTGITKILVFLPSPEELEKTSGYFYGPDLKRENKQTDLGSMVGELDRRDITISVKTKENVYGKSEFMALEISYEVQYIPEIDDKQPR